jgi:hypothetical protein
MELGDRVLTSLTETDNLCWKQDRNQDGSAIIASHFSAADLFSLFERELARHGGSCLGMITFILEMLIKSWTLNSTVFLG